MKCIHCGYIIPDDSEFCPYCGEKIETGTATTVFSDSSEQVNVDSFYDNQIERERITKSQRYFDSDYGYSPENPIVTSSIPMIGCYLTALRTLDGKPFTWTRLPRQSDSEIDIYRLFLDGAPYKTIYFTATGNDTEYVPADLVKDADVFEAAKKGISISQLIAERENDKKKADNKRTKKRKALKCLVFVCLAAAIAIGGYYAYQVGYPFLQYNLAINNIKSNPQKSIETFEALYDYKSSSELLPWAHYYRMKQLSEQGDYAGALAEADAIYALPHRYAIIHDYTNDSGELLLDSASALVDIKEQIELCRLYHAAELLTQEEYLSAIDELSKVSSPDKNGVLLECYYNLIIQSYENKTWDIAYDYLCRFWSCGFRDKYDISKYQYDIIYNYTNNLINENTIVSLEKAISSTNLLIRLYGEDEILNELRDSVAELHTQAIYDAAMKDMSRGEYVLAIQSFKNLDGYLDSDTQMLEAMYQYVHTTDPPEREDSAIVNFLNPYFSYAETLAEKDYKDSKQFYEDLLEWHAIIVMNDDPDDELKICNSISKYAECYAHLLIYGGAPRETIRLRYVFTMSSGETVSGSWDWDLKHHDRVCAWCYYEQPEYAPSGTCKIRIYAVDTGKLIAEDSIRITG